MINDSLRSNSLGRGGDGHDHGVEIGYNATIDKDVAEMMDLRDLRTRVNHKADKCDVIALNGALHDKVSEREFCALQQAVVLKASEADLCMVKNAMQHMATQNDLCAVQNALGHKANQTDICRLDAAVAALTCEVSRKADKCDLVRLQDGVSGIAQGQAAFALKYEVQALHGSVQGMAANLAATASVTAVASDVGDCGPLFDRRLTVLARALAAIYCGIRDDRVRVETLIAAINDPATRSAIQALADAVFARWEQILVQFVSITGGCGDGGFDGGFARY